MDIKFLYEVIREMSKYIMRLDDAAEKMDVEKWNRIELLLDKYNIKPLVGIIPACKDPMMDNYEEDVCFWKKVERWREKKWIIALHGYDHVYCTEEGGINPVNKRSEFAGLDLKQQKQKIKNGIKVFRAHGITPQVFFAPSHTFDENTIEALKTESTIRIISDTVANKPYSKYGMTFVPQQSGSVRKLPFNTVTFCYHPNMMGNEEFDKLEKFLQLNWKKFISFPLSEVRRPLGIVDMILRKMYFLRRKEK